MLVAPGGASGFPVVPDISKDTRGIPADGLWTAGADQEREAKTGEEDILSNMFSIVPPSLVDEPDVCVPSKPKVSRIRFSRKRKNRNAMESRPVYQRMNGRARTEARVSVKI